LQFVQIDYKKQIRKYVYTIIAITLNLLLDPFIIGFFKDIIHLFNYNSPVPYNSVPAIGLLVMVPLVTVFTGLSIWIWREGKQQQHYHHHHKHQPQQQIKKESSLDVYSQGNNNNNNNNNLPKQLSNFFLKAQHLDLVGTLQQITTTIIIPVPSEKNDKIKVLVCDNNENNNNNIWIPCQIEKVIISSQAASNNNNNNNKISSRISTLKNLRIKDPLVPSPDQAYL
jgi:hypothetical protein